jgi:hypothetical protein
MIVFTTRRLGNITYGHKLYHMRCPFERCGSDGVSNMRTPTYRIVLFVIFASLLLLATLLGTVIVYQEFIYKEERTDAILEVEEVYFVLMASSPNEYRISVKMFVTNVGETDCDGKVRAFIIDRESNIAMDDAESDVGTIPAGKTIETSLEMEVLYNGSFRVELLVFKDGLITVKGSGVVNLAYKGSGGADYQNSETDDTERAKEKDGAIPFIGVPTIILAAFLIAILMVSIKRRRWSS